MWPAENILQSMWLAVLCQFPTPALEGGDSKTSSRFFGTYGLSHSFAGKNVCSRKCFAFAPVFFLLPAYSYLICLNDGLVHAFFTNKNKNLLLLIN